MPARARGRAGGAAGCLLILLLLVGAVYVGFRFGLPYSEFWRFRDAMRAQAEAAEIFTNEEIRTSLARTAAELGLPLQAGDISIRRGRSRIEIGAAWEVEVALPKYRRTLHFQPSVSAPVTSQPP